MDTLTSLDRSIFLSINNLPHTQFFDTVALGFSGVGQWGWIWIVLGLIFLCKDAYKNRLFLVQFVIIGVLSIVSEYILKAIIARPRPTEDIGAIILATPGNYSFPSTHATFAFAFSYIFASIDPRISVWLYALALCISLSRVYLGVHYAFDIMAGASLGILIGRCARSIGQYLLQKNGKKSKGRR